MLPLTLASTAQPEAQPAVKSAVQSGGSDSSINSLDKPGGEIRPPDFALPPQTEAVSGSIPPPQANSLQFKAGSVGVALSTFKGSLPLPDFIGRANLFVAAHRVGYAGNGLLGNATRALAGIGQLFDPYASADTLSTVLRTVKALGNAGGYAIDFSRVDDKRAAARNYLCAPRRQGGYLLAGVADPRDPVELRAVRARPRDASSDKATRTPDGKQTDVGSQTAARESVKQIQASQRELDSALSARARLPTPEVHVPASVKGNVHWLPIDAVALASSGHNARMHAGPNDVVNLSSDALGLAGDAAATVNVNANRVFAVGAKTLSLLSTAVGLAPSAAQLSSDVIELIRHPDSAQAKWNVANGALQLGAGLAAAAASFVFPPAALAPLLFPNLAEIGRALDLHQDEQVLRANGLATEADAVHGKYVNASLDATPLVNWFSSFYTHSLRPEIERFEMGQGNRPGAPPMGELPPAARGDPRVVDFYGQALRERMHILEGAAQAYLQQIADTAQLDSVTLVSRSPQMFGWPANGQPMRVFDRAVALTWSRASGTVHGVFFGKDVDGCFRLPVRTEGVTTAAGKKNLVVVSDMLDSERKAVRFDLAGFRADTSGSIRIYDPRGYTV